MPLFDVNTALFSLKAKLLDSETPLFGLQRPLFASRTPSLGPKILRFDRDKPFFHRERAMFGDEALSLTG